MITNIRIQNFKQFEDINLEVAQSVVFIGPNNSGKTSLFQALCLWEIGVRKFLEARVVSGNKNGLHRIVFLPCKVYMDDKRHIPVAYLDVACFYHRGEY